MTEPLTAIEATHAFDPVALPGYRGANYVPFEQLTGDACETRLGDAIKKLNRTAVIGPIGSGKSSLVEFVLENLDGVAPLWISAAHEGPETLRDPVEFARHLIRQIVRWAASVSSMSDEERRAALTSSSRTHSRRTVVKSQTIGVRLAAWIEPSWSREIQQTLADPEVERDGGEVVASLDRLVDLIFHFGLTPVVVIDDSDRWLGTPSPARQELLTAFFSQTARLLAERNWAVVIAVHPEYGTSPTYRAAAREGWVNNRIDVPALQTPAALVRLFDERIARGVRDATEWDAVERGEAPPSAAGGWPTSASVFETGFEAVFWERYNETGNLRPVFTIADQAVRDALLRGDSIITCDSLRETILNLGLD